MARMMETDETVIKNMHRANDTLHGCILGLPVSEATRGILLDQLRILYEYAMYPIVVPGTARKATFRETRGTGAVSNAGVGDQSFSETDLDTGHR